MKGQMVAANNNKWMSHFDPIDEQLLDIKYITIPSVGRHLRNNECRSSKDQYRARFKQTIRVATDLNR